MVYLKKKEVHRYDASVMARCNVIPGKHYFIYPVRTTPYGDVRNVWPSYQSPSVRFTSVQSGALFNKTCYLVYTYRYY